MSRRTVEERFWSKVQKGDGCWLWTAGVFKCGGYGQFRVGGAGTAPSRAHRVSYEFAFGPIDPGLCVCHHCDNPRCVRPSHLFPGTAADNMRDMRAKGRGYDIQHKSGDECASSRLNSEQVRWVRSLPAGSMSQRSIGKRLGVSKFAISCILKGRTWRTIL